MPHSFLGYVSLEEHELEHVTNEGSKFRTLHVQLTGSLHNG